MNIETENIEFKSQFTEDIYKEVIAFANTDGGIVYVGIDNNGNAVGLTDDASCVEYCRKGPVHLTEGSYDNLKITTPEDLLLAEILCDAYR